MSFMDVLLGALFGVGGTGGAFAIWMKYRSDRQDKKDVRDEKKRVDQEKRRVDDITYIHDGYREWIERQKEEAEENKEAIRVALAEVEALKRKCTELVEKDMQKVARITQLELQLANLNQENNGDAEPKADTPDRGRPFDPEPYG